MIDDESGAAFQRRCLFFGRRKRGNSREDTQVLPIILFSLAMELPVGGLSVDQSESGAEPPVERVAREMLRLQQELGGSIVSQGFLPESGNEGSPPQPSTVTQDFARCTKPSRQVVALRAAAWELEKSAHELESVDLYEQADLMRSTAKTLRLEARKLRKRQ